MSKLPLFPTTVVGSWPRPGWLLTSLKKKNRGEVTEEEFNEVADEAALLAIKYQEDAGIDVITDGEQRRDNFYSFVTDKIEGMRLMAVADLLDYIEDKARFEQLLRSLDVPAFAIKNPVIVGKIRKKKNLALDEYKFTKNHTRKLVKVTLPGPYMLLRSSWVKELSSKFYKSRDDLVEDTVKILREEIIALKDSGAFFVQLDEPILSEVVHGAQTTETFMCAALTTKVDPQEELWFASHLINETVKGISGVKLGVHVCRGNWSPREDVLLSGSYEPLAPYLVDMKVDQLVLEFATPRAGDIDVFKEYPSSKEIGLGVVNPRSPSVEKEDFIKKKVEQATNYFDMDKIYLNPDCGFGTFAERPVNTPKVAFEKLKVMVKVAESLRREYE